MWVVQRCAHILSMAGLSGPQASQGAQGVVASAPQGESPQPAIASSANLKSQKKRLHDLEQRLHQYMDREDERVKEVRLAYRVAYVLSLFIYPCNMACLYRMNKRIVAVS